MTPWQNAIPGRFPLRLNAKVRVQFRDGSTSRHEATVSDYHGCGDESSNWLTVGEAEDIVAFEEVAA
jgi:hypothetical protein